MAIETIALVVGAVTMAAGGFALAIVLLLGISWLVGLVGRKLFNDLRRVYHLTVIGYWLDRLEQGGMREFRKAEEEDRAKRSAATGTGGGE